MQTDGTLLVPDVPTVPYITGDGVGAEVTPAMQAVVDAAIRKAYSGKRAENLTGLNYTPKLGIHLMYGRRAFCKGRSRSESGGGLYRSENAGISSEN